MANYALLTAVGADRPGIVASIAGVLVQNDCNIEDSEMARLGPDFACMLMIRMPEGMVSQQLENRVAQSVNDMGLRVHVHDLRPEEAFDTQPQRARQLIHVYGADRKGIVHRITRQLADQSVNITNLHTEVVRHQTPLYVMMIEVELPPFVDSGRLQSELAAIGQEIGVTVAMKPKDDARF